VKRKRHHLSELFSRSHSGHQGDDGDENDKHKLRKRVLSNPSAVHRSASNVSLTGAFTQNDTEAGDVDSLAGSVQQPRTGSGPSTLAKQGRRHSKFEIYVVDPLERRASSIVHKIREGRHSHSHSEHANGKEDAHSREGSLKVKHGASRPSSPSKLRAATSTERLEVHAVHAM